MYTTLKESSFFNFFLKYYNNSFVNVSYLTEIIIIKQTEY